MCGRGGQGIWALSSCRNASLQLPMTTTGPKCPTAAPVTEASGALNVRRSVNRTIVGPTQRKFMALRGGEVLATPIGRSLDLYEGSRQRPFVTSIAHVALSASVGRCPYGPLED